MYSVINPTEVLTEEAKNVVVQNDRMLYVDYFKAIEEFVMDKGGVISGKIASQLLLNESINKDSFAYEIYLDDAAERARELVDKLSSIKNAFVDSKYIYSRTRYRGREIEIHVDTRKFAVILSPSKHQQISMVKLMGDNIVSGHHVSQINVVPVEFLLIDVYRKLYSPFHASEWAELYDGESNLYKLVGKSLSKSVLKPIEGGKDADADAAAVAPAPTEEHPNKREIVSILLEHLRDTEHVLIGDYADRFDAKNARLQIISATSIDELVKEFTASIGKHKQVKLIHTHSGVTADTRVHKYTVYAWSKQNQIPLCDIYNSASVEPIPYIDGKGDHKDIKIGNLYVQARFRLIDLWAMKLIVNKNRMEGEEGKVGWSVTRINHLLQSYERIKKQISQTAPSKLFQTNNYVGIYENINATKRKLYGYHAETYYPAAQSRKTGGIEDW